MPLAVVSSCVVCSRLQSLYVDSAEVFVAFPALSSEAVLWRQSQSGGALASNFCVVTQEPFYSLQIFSC